jgi:hypothetical protein
MHSEACMRIPACVPVFSRNAIALALALTGPAAAPIAFAQTKAPVQVVKPPVAQLWIDVGVHTMPGMPEMPAMPAGMGGMFGGSQGGNVFGNARNMALGRHADIAFFTQRKPGGTEATQTVPAGSGLAPSLPLVPVKVEPRGPTGPGTPREPGEYEPPKGRILFYWGCSETVRPGQPRVLDFSKAAPTEWGNFMQGRAPRERGAVARPGHSIWPNEKDRRSFGRDASLAGEHSLSGEGVPADLKFAIGTAHDFMPPLALQQTGTLASALNLSWQAVPHARAYFLNAMSGGEEAGVTEMVFWSSAEVPDFGMGLIDYASPANIEQWLREKVLLAPSVTQCAIPAGIFAKGQGGMLRMIAYGPELNLAHPPRPTDVRVPWEPEWAVRVRTKSTAMAILGQSADAGSRMGAAPAASPQASAGARPRPDCPPPASGDSTAAAVGGAIGGSVGRAVGGALGGLFGKKEEKKEPPPADCPK